MESVITTIIGAGLGMYVVAAACVAFVQCLGRMFR